MPLSRNSGCKGTHFFPITKGFSFFLSIFANEYDEPTVHIAARLQYQLLSVGGGIVAPSCKYFTAERFPL